MNQVRGVIMIALGGWALFMGWHNLTGSRSLFAYALGALALAVGLWRITRKNEPRT